MQRERSAGRFPAADLYVGRMPCGSPRRSTDGSKGDAVDELIPYDAWVLVRVLSDQPVNGELAAMSDAWRPLAEKLAAMPPHSASQAWIASSLDESDRDAIIKALTDVDPLGDRPRFLVNGTPYRSSWRPKLDTRAQAVSSGRTSDLEDISICSHPTQHRQDLCDIGCADLAWRAVARQSTHDVPRGEKDALDLWGPASRRAERIRRVVLDFPPRRVLLNASPDEPYGAWDQTIPKSGPRSEIGLQAEKPGLDDHRYGLWRHRRRLIEGG